MLDFILVIICNRFDLSTNFLPVGFAGVSYLARKRIVFKYSWAEMIRAIYVMWACDLLLKYDRQALPKKYSSCNSNRLLLFDTNL